MDNLIYSLNGTMPIFLVILISYVLKLKGMLNESFITSANKFSFSVAMPILLFNDIASSNIYETFRIDFFIFCAASTIISIAVIWFLSSKFIKDKYSVGSFIQGCFRGSSAILGVALMQNLYGSAAMASVMIIASVPLYNAFSVVILTFNSSKIKSIENKSEKFKKALTDVIKNPLIIGILLGLIFSLLRIKLPTIIQKTINNFSSMATPLALVTIGAAFKGGEALSKIKLTAIASFIKLIVLPGLFLPIAVFMGFKNEMLVAALVMLSSPTTISSYIMAKSMDNDDVLASSIIVVTTLLSAFTITLFIFIFKTMNLI